MNLIQPEHPFFRPAYRRIITVAVAASWAVMEWTINDPFWALIATCMAGLAYYELIFNYKLPPQEAAKGDEPDAKP